MFEDVFEPLDDIIDDKEASDEWGDVWDTGEKEDMWRADAEVWSVNPIPQQPGPQVIHPGPVTPAPDPPVTTAPDPAIPPDPILPPTGPMNNTPETEDEIEDNCQDCEKDCEEETCKECDQGCDKGSGLFDDLFLDIF